MPNDNFERIKKLGEVLEIVLKMQHWADPLEKADMIEKIGFIRVGLLEEEQLKTIQMLKDLAPLVYINKQDMKGWN